jgi:hypothetical protein
MSVFQLLVGWYAYGARARIRNSAFVQVGSNTILRFSDKMFKAYIDALPKVSETWTTVKRIIRDNRGHWRDEVKNYYSDLPDDLLEAAASRSPQYRPSEIARVHAARIAGFSILGYSDSQLNISQHQTIQREVKEYLERER